MAEISVIIPVYKTEPYLAACLDSLLAQSFGDWEAILVDDGSPDGSGALCDAYAERDGRFRVIHQPNAGPGAARNRGLDFAQGRYVCFVDSDDWLGTSFLSQVTDARYEGVDVLFWGYTEAYQDRLEKREVPQCCAYGEQEAWRLILQLKRARRYGYMVVSRFRKSIIDAHHLRFATDIRVHEDLCFTNAYCQYVQSAASVNNTDYFYRMAAGASLSNRFYPSDECLLIARHLKASCWRWMEEHNCLEEPEIYAYLSKLNLAVMNMFDPQDVPAKSYRGKIERIRFVRQEVKRYYGRYESISRLSHKIYRYLNVHLICCYQLLSRFIR